MATTKHSTANKPTPTTCEPETNTLQPGMGAIPHAAGTTFRVWAPHAEKVSVMGTFNDWNPETNPLAQEADGYWATDVANAGPGKEYRYQIINGEQTLSRIDPYAREVTNSIGNGIIHDPEYDWGNDQPVLPAWNEMVIYELHIGTFHDPDPESDQPGTFRDAMAKFGHLKKLGVNTIQIMPVAEFAGDRSWGYNPAHPFAVETAYGGPEGLKNFVKTAHASGFAVILDVVYNHFGPSDLDMWRFDGWSENDGGGIYFYQDWRSETPWGATRPDYGRKEVRQYIRDNAIMWLEDYHIDGLRMDMTLYIRSVRADAEPNLPDGWTLLQWVNSEINEKFPGRITIAEDLQNSESVTKHTLEGGAGFGSQWDARFVHPIREAVITPDDQHRSMVAVCDAIQARYNINSFERVIYSESHDEVANGSARVPYEIDAANATGSYAQKRSTLASAIVFTAPGIPMIFQGQEFLEGEWFRDTVPVHWDQQAEFRGVVRLYRDLINLRLNRSGQTRGLTGQHVKVYHVNDDMNVVAYHRWEQGGVNDDVVVVASFSHEARDNYRIGFPSVGPWKLLFNSDSTIYSEQFSGHNAADAIAGEDDYDGYTASAEVNVGPYSVLIFARTV